MQRANVYSDQCAYDADDPAGYRSAVSLVGEIVGGEALAVKVFEVPPEQSVCPYHYEYEEEWLVVLEGSVVLRTPQGEETLCRGDIVRFAPGPSGAHKATNRADENARLMMFSSAREPAMAVYPDSNKLGVWPGAGDEPTIFHRGDGGVDYFDGER